jgi:hypothetical protein
VSDFWLGTLLVAVTTTGVVLVDALLGGELAGPALRWFRRIRAT